MKQEMHVLFSSISFGIIQLSRAQCTYLGDYTFNDNKNTKNYLRQKRFFKFFK